MPHCRGAIQSLCRVRYMSATTSFLPAIREHALNSSFHPFFLALLLPNPNPNAKLLCAVAPAVSSSAIACFTAGGHRLPEWERDRVGRAEGTVHVRPRYPRGTQRVPGMRTA